MQFDLSHAIEILRSTPQTLRSWLGSLSDPWIHSDYGAGTFSVYDVLGHLIHGEKADWITRARIILEQGRDRPFDPFDRYAQFEESRGKPFAALLDEFERLRRANLETLAELELGTKQFALHGTHPALGEVTLENLLATWAVHDLNHLAQIARAQAAQYAQAVGPWREYLSILNLPATRMDDEGVRRKAAARQ